MALPNASTNLQPHVAAAASKQTSSDEAASFYLKALEILDRSRIPYLIGGAYALKGYTGIDRCTKDLDVFVSPADVLGTIDYFKSQGFDGELVFPHWLGKVFDPADSSNFIDVIFASGNGLCPVDGQWFENAAEAKMFGISVRLVPVEEMIWSKAFVCERERYDGADILHLIQAQGHKLNWRRLLDRFAGHEPVLLSHLLLFDYVYPAERDRVPTWVIDALLKAVRTAREIPTEAAGRRVCRGTFLSREQYLTDILTGGFDDARLQPHGPMRPQDIEHWTRAIGKIK